MKSFNILFTGVGGTGVITAARILASAALTEGQNAWMGEIHGMAQRLGAVSVAVRIGDTVYGPIIPTGTANMLVSVEPIEALRRVDKVSSDGTILVGMLQFVPTAVLLGRAQYPNIEDLLQNLQRFSNVVAVDAEPLAREAGNILTINIVLLGAAVGLGQIPVKEKSIINALKDIIRPRYHEMNLRAFEKGKQASVSARRLNAVRQ